MTYVMKWRSLPSKSLVSRESQPRVIAIPTLARTTFSHNLSLMASPSDPASRLMEESIGKKVRILLHDEGGGYRDLLGELISPGSVRRKDGTVVAFDHSQVFAFRIEESRTS